MKKILVAVLAIAVACMCLVGCGGGDFEGKWECESMTTGGMTISDNFMGIPIAVVLQFELESGGEGTAYSNSNGKTIEQELSWEVDGKTCTITIEGDPLDFELEDGKLVATMSANGQKITYTLKKVKKFTEFTEEDAKNAMGNLLGGSDD